MTWINYNPSRDKHLHPYRLGWNNIAIPKLERCNRWILEMDKWSCFILYCACDYLPTLELKLIPVRKRVPSHYKGRRMSHWVKFWSWQTPGVQDNQTRNCMQSYKEIQIQNRYQTFSGIMKLSTVQGASNCTQLPQSIYSKSTTYLVSHFSRLLPPSTIANGRVGGHWHTAKGPRA